MAHPHHCFEEKRTEKFNILQDAMRVLSLLSQHVKLQGEAWDTRQQVTETRKAMKRELSGPEERLGYHLPRGM